MSFEQLMSIVPRFEAIETFHGPRTISHPPDLHLLLIVTRGHITVTTEGREPVVVTQGFACHPGRFPCLIQTPKTKPAEYVCLSYRIFPSDSPWDLHGPLRTLSEVKIKYMLDELFRTLEEIDIHNEAEASVQEVRKRLILERILFIYLYETFMVREGSASTRSIEGSLSYLNEHYMLKLTLPMLAERAGMSPGHYTVRFKQQTGMTMTRYLLKLRIRKAQQMFQQTHLSAKEIAQRVGFVDYFHFSRCFKQEVGCSPTDYKKSLEEI